MCRSSCSRRQQGCSCRAVVLVAVSCGGVGRLGGGWGVIIVSSQSLLTILPSFVESYVVHVSFGVSCGDCVGMSKPSLQFSVDETGEMTEKPICNVRFGPMVDNEVPFFIRIRPRVSPRTPPALKMFLGSSWRSSGSSQNDELVTLALRRLHLQNLRVCDAMKRVDRGFFCETTPYEDSPQQICTLLPCFFMVVLFLNVVHNSWFLPFSCFHVHALSLSLSLRRLGVCYCPNTRK